MFTRSRKKLVFCFLQAAILPQGPAEHGEARCARRASPPVRGTPAHTQSKETSGKDTKMGPGGRPQQHQISEFLKPHRAA